MSGIAVRFQRDHAPADADAVYAMLAAIPYRGVDGMWVRSLGQVALGYAKLTMTPEEVTEQQPLVSPRTGCAIVADVRLDNRSELLAQFSDLSPSTSDAELIIHAYERWDTRVVDHLLGDYAFVIWDARSRRIVCARDSSGQRPLFYRIDASMFTAASEIHQIFQDATVPIEPNEEHILFGLLPDNVFRNAKQRATTPYQGILSLLPGYLMVVTPEHHTIESYWSLDPQREIRYRTDAEYVEHFRELLFRAVSDRLRTVHPIGVALSGGMDSSSIVCTALTIMGGRDRVRPGVIAFSSVFGDLDCDERPYIESIQDVYDLDVHYIPSLGMNNRLQLRPSRFQESVNMSLNEDRETMLGVAQLSGVRAVLTGDVADSCVQGSWLVFDSLLRQGRLRELYQLALDYRALTGTSWPTVMLHTFPPQLPLPIQRRIMQASVQRWFAKRQHLLLPDWMPEALRVSLAQQTAEIAVSVERQRRYANQTQHYESALLYPPEAAGTTAPWSLQVWRPFADRRLHEFLMAIPPEQKFNTAPGSGSAYGRSKWLLRRTMEGIVPDTIRLRHDKTNFAAAHASAIVSNWPDYVEAFGSGRTSEIARRGYVEPDRFWNRLQRTLDGESGPDSIYLAHLIGLETWLRSFSMSRAQQISIPRPSPSFLNRIAIHIEASGGHRANDADSLQRASQSTLSPAALHMGALPEPQRHNAPILRSGRR